MAITDTFKEMPFILKFAAMIVNIVTVIIWATKNTLPCYNFSDTVLFEHVVGGYSVILVAVVILYLMDERPGEWAHRLILVVGAVLFLAMGLVGIIKTLDKNGGSWNLIVGILCLTDGILLLVDFIIKAQFC